MCNGFVGQIGDCNFSGMNEIWDEWVVPSATPTRATVEAKLARPECLIEIMVTAVVK